MQNFLAGNRRFGNPVYFFNPGPCQMNALTGFQGWIQQDNFFALSTIKGGDKLQVNGKHLFN